MPKRTLYINGDISEEKWTETDVTPSAFRAELYADTGPVIVKINSYGGDCVAAAQIYNLLREYPSPVEVRIDGIAASAASVVAMAGDVVFISPPGLMMLHDPLTFAYGNQKDMEKAIDLLTAVKESILNAYTLKTGLPREEISQLMTEETWLDATKAIELGFADGMIDRADIADEANTTESPSTQQPRTVSDILRKLETIKRYID